MQSFASKIIQCYNCKINIITLWHGGRSLESSYRENTAAKGLWEYGPRLYLTTSYQRASSYAKGGGSTYKVEVSLGGDIRDVTLDLQAAYKFIDSHVVASKKNQMLDDIHRNVERMALLSADIFLNLIINNEAIKKTKTHILNEFLVTNGADYSIVDSYGGSHETVLVVFNRSQIKSVKKIAAKDVSAQDYDIVFENKRNKEMIGKILKNKP